MKTPRPHAFVRVGSLLAMLRRLSGRVRKGRGWGVSELGGDQWLSRGPRYWFAGQARRGDGGVVVEPFWVRVLGESGYAQFPLSGSVAVPVPGVLGVQVVWEVTWGPDAVSPSVLSRSQRVVSVELMGAASPVPALRAAVDYSIPVSSVVITSSRPLAMAWVVLATLDVNGVVTHVDAAAGLGVGVGVLDVAMPEPEVFFEGVAV